MSRQQISMDEIDAAIRALERHIKYSIRRNGHSNTFASIFEVVGMLTIEMGEFVSSIHQNPQHAARVYELLVIAANCIHAVACINAETLDE